MVVTRQKPTNKMKDRQPFSITSQSFEFFQVQANEPITRMAEQNRKEGKRKVPFTQFARSQRAADKTKQAFPRKESARKSSKNMSFCMKFNQQAKDLNQSQPGEVSPKKQSPMFAFGMGPTHNFKAGLSSSPIIFSNPPSPTPKAILENPRRSEGV